MRAGSLSSSVKTPPLGILLLNGPVSGSLDFGGKHPLYRSSAALPLHAVPRVGTERHTAARRANMVKFRLAWPKLRSRLWPHLAVGAEANVKTICACAFRFPDGNW